MNILPMFLNIFIPWSVYIYCFSLSSFYLMYAHPFVAWSCISLIFVLWLAFVLIAYCARKYDPDPTWFTFFSVLMFTCAIWGILAGLDNLKTNEAPYYTVKEMTHKKAINPSYTSGEDVMDAGVIEFEVGTSFDPGKTWHFKDGELYCAAPIISSQNQVPLRQTYDFWAVGKNCCAPGASDFRCGSWGSSTAHYGLRTVDEGDLNYYRLAVQQAEALYGIMAPHPIFLKWSEDPAREVLSWHAQGFKNFLVFGATNLVFCIFCVAMASARFAFLGRTRSAYDTTVLNQVPEDRDMRAKMYTA